MTLRQRKPSRTKAIGVFAVAFTLATFSAAPAFACGTARGASLQGDDERAEIERVFGSDVEVVALRDLSPEQVRTLQKELSDRGLYRGSVDGVPGPLTRSALSELAAHHKQVTDDLLRQGQLTSETLQILGVDPSEIQPVAGADEPTAKEQKQSEPASASSDQGKESEATPQREEQKSLFRDITDEPGGVTQGDRRSFFERIVDEPGGVTQD